MSEERKMILNMLSEGKISVEEATKLLNALGENKPDEDKKSDNKKYDDDHGAHKKSKKNSYEFDFDNDDFKKSIREAKLASKEAMRSVKDNVKEAIEESRKALSETLKNRKLNSNIDQLRSVNSTLANEWEEAEGEFEEAKGLHEEVQGLADEIKELNDYLGEIDDLRTGKELSDEEAKDQLAETQEKLKDLMAKKEVLLNEAKEKSERAQNRILEVRRRCKDLNIHFDNNAKVEDEIANQFQNVGEVISQATSQIGPMISKLIDGFSFSGFDGYEVKEEFTFSPEKQHENVTLNINLQNGAIRVVGEDDRDNILVKVRKKVKCAKEHIEEVAADLLDIRCAGNIVNLEVKRKFNNRHTVSVDMFVPKKYMYDCYLKSTNGRIKIADIEGKAWLLSTSNGKIVVEEGKVEKIKAASSNGSLQIEVNAQETDLVTSNGSIRLYLPQNAYGSAKLITSNGSIKVFAGELTNACFNAKTSMGTIKVDNNWHISNSQTRSMKKSMSAATKGFDETKPYLDIVAKTSNGSIKVLDED
ncbi:DUF4097 family beta strand repeat protein [Clostridium sp. 'deep sea']|uniref:SHOCT-like domain-containing protein n=1 Tax=Clostridium sp. 'deep sea' TaxID=2779445 RepID=UPI0018965001|nr:DUF4097 family beta strand repeat-containing protein [Clostridium sp. 'deep sea']QOR34258.1 DUF4097 family beta strand repeat protein [Clostridium sp. 'deep sea']